MESESKASSKPCSDAKSEIPDSSEELEQWTWGQSEGDSLAVAANSNEPSIWPVLRLGSPLREPSPLLPRRNLKEAPLTEFRKGSGSIKHEDFIIKICRRLTKSIKRVLHGKAETFTGLTAAVHNGLANEKLEVFRQTVLHHRTCLEPFFQSDSDCKDWKRQESSFRSYSKAYVANFLDQTPYLKIAYYYYCQVIFDGNCEALCRAWRMRCCSSKLHGKKCEKRWERLRVYTQSKMLEELGLAPFLP